jgi:hypothetical protein
MPLDSTNLRAQPESQGFPSLHENVGSLSDNPHEFEKGAGGDGVG